MSLLPALVVQSSMDPEPELDVGELVRLFIGRRMCASAAFGAPGSLSGLPVGGIRAVQQLYCCVLSKNEVEKGRGGEGSGRQERGVKYGHPCKEGICFIRYD